MSDTDNTNPQPTEPVAPAAEPADATNRLTVQFKGRVNKEVKVLPGTTLAEALKLADVADAGQYTYRRGGSQGQGIKPDEAIQEAMVVTAVARASGG